MHTPGYLKLYREGTLKVRIEQAVSALSVCTLCPRECGADRTKGRPGFCKTGRKARVASFGPHFGEESPLVGSHGSGTIFFSSCNLLCTFCQNYDISHLAHGSEATPEELASMMVELADSGCHNINFVTPSHVIPQILEALPCAIEQGLKVPLVYNTGGYDKVESLKLLEGICDIYMPDFKFWDSAWSERYCRAPDYRDVALKAIKEMHAQVGDLVIEHGIAVKGLLLRHLVMPNGVAGTEEIMRFIAESISRHTYVNVMNQYRPCYTSMGDEIIGRSLTIGEYTRAVQAARTAGILRLDKHN